ncbi:MAG: YceI family protein [Myxococcota bacterium]
MNPALALIALMSGAHAQDEAPAPTEAAAKGATTYTLDAGRSVLAVLVKYDRNALISGHDHIVQASSFKGTVTWDPADPAACAIDISFPVTALVVDPPGSRERAGLEGTTSDGDKKKIKDNFEGKSQLDASSFPQIAFKSTKCTANGDKVQVTGPLTMHGVGHDVTASMKITADGSAFSAKGTFSGTHADWKFDPFTAVFGSLRNDDALAFTVDVKGTAQ